ncbi:Casein kinase I homolog hhp2, putative [Trichomonas vaginalis G3]|uniref:Casein kinase I homolog hhp2, putative n=1 Tax=Trichomonas vaginalis (strain ATCC PRA-98 / G3) TaxID=412133 RepID=A2FSY1_TRIV3|nr:peptidyl-serine phosphorylation [Trichomonas vaginalis G3]EAX91977.1 Casein kinase I homolog hhp2, putative [Trichomonas vaginalis G3]KAI5531163.1 peptidyl-serine phosphorylation [Trichomonas vaginalis G3]|eukprot:XP_001304907.1 Casein kinase I homolog hhp2 [Trichomonas vaginalis G3]
MKGFEQSRRDDLEFLGYVWLYLLRGSLPWEGLPSKTSKQKYQVILDVKMQTSPEELCYGFPNEFVEYFQKIRELEFENEPDYASYRKLFCDHILMTTSMIGQRKQHLQSKFLFVLPSKYLDKRIHSPQHQNTRLASPSNFLLRLLHRWLKIVYFLR